MHGCAWTSDIVPCGHLSDQRCSACLDTGAYLLQGFARGHGAVLTDLLVMTHLHSLSRRRAAAICAADSQSHHWHRQPRGQHPRKGKQLRTTGDFTALRFAKTTDACRQIDDSNVFCSFVCWSIRRILPTSEASAVYAARVVSVITTCKHSETIAHDKLCS